MFAQVDRWTVVLLAMTLLLLPGGALPCLGAEGKEAVSLDGQWRFKLDPNKVGVTKQWFAKQLPNAIKLPGTTDEAGYGEKTSGSDNGQLTRVYKYYGPAWYQRDIDIPQAWDGKCVSLLLERVMWKSSVWIDGEAKGARDSLGTAHRFDLGPLKPGKHTLTVCVDNSQIHPIGNQGHCYSDSMQGIWNGILGRIELAAEEPVRIRQQRIFTKNDGTVRVELTVTKASGGPVGGKIDLSVREKKGGKLVGAGDTRFDIPGEITVDGRCIQRDFTVAEVTLKLDGAPKLWSEFDPALYILETRLTASHHTDFAAETFGFREVSRDKNRLLINGRPSFMRGNIDCVHFPLTGYPPCDVAAWKRLFRITKEYGLNQVRFHSWCPPKAAFQAADEEGIYLQPEILWIDSWMNNGVPGLGKNFGTLDQYVRTEMRRIVDTYGNHPSFVLFAIGNELGNSNFDVTGQWIKEEKEHDPRRFYAASTARTITPFCDFSDTHAIGGGGPEQCVNRFATGHTDWDFDDAYGHATVPIIAHELGQAPVYPLWSEIAKYTGTLRPRNLDRMREVAEKNGIAAQDKEFQQASGAMNRILYKENIEAVLRSAHSSGFSMLSMTDYAGQGEALVGWLDSFYGSKGIVAPAQFRCYSNTTVPLARFAKYVWNNGEKFQAVAQVAHWGPQPLAKTIAVWRLRDARDNVIAHGEFAPTDFPVGSLTTLGPLEVDLKPIGRAARLQLDIAVRGTEFANDWNVWVFPARTATAPADVVVCDRLDAALKGLSQGRRVLLLAHRLGTKANARYAPWLPLSWSAMWYGRQDRETLGALVQNRHPALTGFPTDAHLDWQWLDICDGARGFVLDDMPADYRPIVQPVSDFHFNHKLGSIFEFRTKEGGRLLVCGYNIVDNLSNRPAAQQLRQSLLDYAAGPVFMPNQEVTAEYLNKLLPDARM